MFGKHLRLLAALAAIALVLSCGGGRKAPSLSSDWTTGVLARHSADPPPSAHLWVAPPFQAATRSETTLSETLTDLDSLPTPAGVDASLFSELKAALRQALLTHIPSRRGSLAPPNAAHTSEPRESPGWLARPTQSERIKLASTPPTGEANRVDDLELIDNGDGTYTLTWSYRNAGDYNQDGIVNIMDITPLAAHFNETADSSNEWIDGNSDTVINIQDITPLAANFFSDCAGHRVQGQSAPSSWTNIDSVPFSLALNDAERLYSEYDLDSLTHDFYRVVPYDAAGVEGVRSVIVPQTSSLPPNILDLSPRSGTSGESISFIAIVEGSEPLSYSWDFGGGADPNESAEESPTVVLGYAGTCSAWLTVTNALGSDTLPFTLAVNVAGTPPNINSVAPLTGTSGYEVTFLADVSGDEPLSYSWNFGGGATPNTSNESEPRVTLGGAADYHASLTATNMAGNDELQFTLTVAVGDGGNGGLADSPWPKYRRDYKNSARSPYLASQKGTLKWRFPVSYPGGPAVGIDGTIFFLAEGVLRAVHPNGTLRWEFDSGTSSYYGTPLIASDGTVLFQGEVYVQGGEGSPWRGYLYALSSDGRSKWVYEIREPIGSPPAISTDGTIYWHDWQRFLYAVNPDGTLRWRYETGGGGGSSTPAVGTDGTIYVGSWDGFVCALNPDGTLRWRFDAGADPTDPARMSSPAIGYDESIYVGGMGNLYAIKPDGTLKWTNQNGGYADASPSIGPDSTIYVGFWFYEEEVPTYGVSATYPDGSLRWDFQLDDAMLSAAVVGADGTIYLICFDGYVYALSYEGTLKWRHYVGGESDSSLGVGADGTLYAGGGDGIYAFAD